MLWMRLDCGKNGNYHFGVCCRDDEFVFDTSLRLSGKKFDGYFIFLSRFDRRMGYAKTRVGKRDRLDGEASGHTGEEKLPPQGLSWFAGAEIDGLRRDGYGAHDRTFHRQFQP